VIDIGYLKDPKDLKTLVEGIKLCRKIASTDALKKYKGEEVYPGVSVQSDSQIEEYIHNVSLLTLYIKSCLSVLIIECPYK
jgi:choline dehydrogenase-like flavoprotein